MVTAPDDVLATEPRWDASRFPPAARSNRLLQTLRFARDPLGELQRARRRHGEVFTLRILPYRAGLVCAADPETNRAVLTDSERFAAGDAAALLEPLIGAGSLILTPSPRHARNRKLLMPPFHGSRLEAWRERVGLLTREHLPELLDGGPQPVRPWAQRLTLDVILRVVLGIDDAERRARFRDALDGLLDPRVQALLFAPAWLAQDRGRLSPGNVLTRRRAAVDRLLADEVAARRADPATGRRDDVLSVLLGARHDDGSGFSDEELNDELKGLVLAGHETTATSLAWTLHLLAHHPAVRADLVASLDHGEDDVLRAVIKESMRLRSPVIDAVRIATRDTELAGRPVPAGAFVSGMFCGMHVDDAVWPDAAEFRPGRHLEGRTDPWSATPFGGGARRCLGAALAQLELEEVVREVLTVAVPEPAGRPEAVRLLGVTLVPSRGGRVTLRPRGAPRPGLE